MFLLPVYPVFANDTADPIIVRLENNDSLVLPDIYFFVSTNIAIPAFTQFEVRDSNEGVVNVNNYITYRSLRNVTVFLEGSYQEVVGLGYSMVINNNFRDR